MRQQSKASGHGNWSISSSQNKGSSPPKPAQPSANMSSAVRNGTKPGHVNGSAKSSMPAVSSNANRVNTLAYSTPAPPYSTQPPAYRTPAQAYSSQTPGPQSSATSQGVKRSYIEIDLSDDGESSPSIASSTSPAGHFNAPGPSQVRVSMGPPPRMTAGRESLTRDGYPLSPTKVLKIEDDDSIPQSVQRRFERESSYASTVTQMAGRDMDMVFSFDEIDESI